VVLAPIASRFGVSGLLTAGLLAGIMLLLLGLFRMGKLIEFIPYPVTSGFTAGVATVIFVLQLKDALGLSTAKLPDHFPEKVLALFDARHTIALESLAVSSFTLLVLLLAPKLTKRLPSPLIAVVLASLLVALLHQLFPAFSVDTVGSRFRSVVDGQVVVGIPRAPPLPMLPWGEAPLSLDALRELLPAAFAICILGAIESLLSAVIADGMTGTRHDSNSELVALGVGNILTPFFGGIPATGALARTATNIRSGAKTPIAAVFHAIFVLVAVLAAAPLVAYVPMASLAALLMLVAFNMSDARHVVHVLRVAPRGDAAVLIICFGLTVLFDMVIAVTFGVLLAALLFMRRMAELTQTRVLQGDSHVLSTRPGVSLPKRVAIYEIAGPLFFGAAQRGMAALDALADDIRVVVLDLSRVPVIDSSGLVALETALERLQRARRFVILGGPLPEPRYIFDRAELELHHENITIADSVSEAIEMARDLVLLTPEWDSHAASSPRSTSLRR
jgi:SulP family sulfate permease